MNATGGASMTEEERMLRRMEEEWDELDETLADFESALPPTDKKRFIKNNFYSICVTLVI